MEYLVIDTESCTGQTDDGSLCSFGYAICDENLNILTKEDIIFNPLPKKFFVGDKKNFKRTGVSFAYTKKEFRSAKKFSESYEKIKDLFSGRLVLGFSMVNDIKYINDACRKFDLPIIEYEFLDIQFIYKLLFPTQTSIGLKTLCEKYGGEFVAHRSDEDAAASLNLLNSFLKSEGYTLNSVIEKYGIKCGKNEADGYYLNYSEAVIKKQYGLTLTKRVANAVYSDFLHQLPQYRNKTKVAFSHKIEKSDIDYLRTLIELIYKENMTFTHDFDICNIYVKADDETENTPILRKKTKIINLSEFERTVGYEKNNYYDDELFLKNYFTEKSR